MEGAGIYDVGPALYIPVGGGEVIAIPYEEMPEEVEDMIEVLAAEVAPLDVWVQVAKAYLAQGKFEQGLQIMEEATSEDIPQEIKDRYQYARLQMLCELSNINISRARAETDQRERVNHMIRATGPLDRARLLDPMDQLVHLTNGHLLFASSEVEKAKSELKMAMKASTASRASVAATLALANILFQQKRFSEAHRYFCQALRAHPNGPPEIRLGLAQCLFRLGKFKLAEAAFRRTLDCSPGCGPALLGLAITSFYKSSDKAMREGMQYLCQAFDADPGQSAVLIMLARLCLNRGDAERARALAAAAHQVAMVPDARAHALVLQGRAHHALANFKDAYTCYQKALEIDSTLPLPLFGTAQLMAIQAGGVDRALQHLEKALDKAPFWPEALTTMGKLFPYAKGRLGAGESAIAHFKEAAKADSSSSLVWEMLGEMLALSDPPGALQAYRKALELKRGAAEREREARRKRLQRARRIRAARHAAEHALENGDAALDSLEDAAEQEQADRLEVLPAQLLNNAAVLHMRGGESHAALALIKEAAQSAAATDYEGLPTGTQVTLGYNSARISEACGNLQQAAAEYRNILEAFPEYSDCALRMACLAGHRGDFPDAKKWIEKALKSKTNLTDAHSLRGWLHLEAQEYDAADQVFQKLVNETAKIDDYGWLGIASILLKSIPATRKKPGDSEKARKYANRALDLYRQVLNKHEGNIYAANGIGAAVAELGEYSSAQKVFMLVQEAAAAAEGFLRMPDAQLNLGILALALEKPKEAVQIFSAVLRKYFSGTSAEVLLLLARAFYDAEQMPQARAALLRAVHLDPTNMQLRFNVALVLQQHAVRMVGELRQRTDDEKAADAQRAVTELHTAVRLFEALEKKAHSEKTGFEAKNVAVHHKFCHSSLQSAQRQQEQAEKESRAKEAKREVSRIQMEAESRKQQLRAEAEAQKRAAAAAQKEDAARTAQERMQQLQNQWRESEALKQAAEQGDADKVGKKRKKSKAAAEEEQVFGEERTAGDRAAALRETGLETSSDDEDYQPNGDGADVDMDKADEEGTGADAIGQREAEDAEAGPAAAGLSLSSPSTGGRLKKKSRIEAEAASALADPENGPQADLGLEDEVEDQQDEATEARIADLFGESDED